MHVPLGILVLELVEIASVVGLSLAREYAQSIHCMANLTNLPSNDERKLVYHHNLSLAIFVIVHHYYLCSLDSLRSLERTLPTMSSGRPFWTPLNGLLVDFIAGLDFRHHFGTSDAIQQHRYNSNDYYL